MQKDRKRKWLFVAPWAQPITGQSVISERVLSILESECEVIKINTNGQNKYLKTPKIIYQIILSFRKISLGTSLYFTVSRSILGSLKDLVLMVFSSRKVDRIYCHIHGSDYLEFLEKNNIYIKYVLLPLMKKVDVFIVTHDIYRGDLQCEFPDSQVVTILNFVE